MTSSVPTAITVAAISFACYILAACIPNAWIVLPVSLRMEMDRSI